MGRQLHLMLDSIILYQIVIQFTISSNHRTIKLNLLLILYNLSLSGYHKYPP
jgi:hypothetical protein